MNLFYTLQKLLVWSVLLLVAAFVLVFFGNMYKKHQQLLQYVLPEHKTILRDGTVTNQTLLNWIITGKKDFALVGFHTGDKCFVGDITSRFPKTHGISKLSDEKWLKSRYPHLDNPMVVFGKNGEESLTYAAVMQKYGYNAFLLEHGFQGFVQEIIMPGKEAYMYDDDDDDDWDDDDDDWDDDDDYTSVTSESREQLLYQYFSENDPNIGKKSPEMRSLREVVLSAEQDDEDVTKRDDLIQEDEEEDEGC